MSKNFLKNISIKKTEENSSFSKIEGLSKFESLTFEKPITFFSGENGTGKSTLLEAIAVNWGFNPEGGSINFNFSTNNTHSDFHNYIRLSKSVNRPTDGFFLRAESFYNVATYVEDIGLDFSEYGNKSLHHQSHGESFLNLINNRFRGNGLYLLDEPEAALSPQRQLSLMLSIKNLIDEGAQFIIVTHSPILLAMPDSQIFSFDGNSPFEISYEESMPYKITSLFLNNKNRMLSELFYK